MIRLHKLQGTLAYAVTGKTRKTGKGRVVLEWLAVRHDVKTLDNAAEMILKT